VSRGEASGDKAGEDNGSEELEGEIVVFHGGWFLFTGAETPDRWGAVANPKKISAAKFIAGM
jgi:hypothetical protein